MGAYRKSLLKVPVRNTGSKPTEALKDGTMYFNSSDNKLYIVINGTWVKSEAFSQVICMKAEKLGLKGEIELVHRDKNRNILDIIRVPNAIMIAGLDECSGLLLTDVGGTAYDYIAIGTGTTAATYTQTQLVEEITTGGGARTAGTGTQTTTTVTNDTSQLVATFTFSAAFAVTESCMINAASEGDMLCRQTFSAINVASDDSLQVTWKVAFS